MIFPPSKLALTYLKGLKGVEIGGSAHNDYGLDTINVDYTDEFTVYKQEEVNMCGEYRKVDVVADAAKLPFEDKSFDFVISSHMLEHHYDPIAVVLEWSRVAKKYLFITVPRKDLTFDKDKEVTPLSHLQDRYIGWRKKPDEAPADDHWTIWDEDAFRSFCEYMCVLMQAKIHTFQSPDDKVGNGMTVMFELNEKEPS